ncbi:MAG: lectin-like protein [Planctomycetota bacterium]|nr:lectin-like protein [Planctomycetota bacterium]
MRRTAFALAGLAGLSSAALAQPANDNCSNAQAISGPLSLPFDNTGATDDNPGDNCFVLGADIWYAWSNPTAGTVTVSLCGSLFDTAVTVYSGTCGVLTEVNCNDDDCGLQSELTFSANAGETYYIAVGGFLGETGAGTLNITVSDPPPPLTNDNCADAIAVTGFSSVSFDNSGATTDGPVNCGSIGADIWYTWTSPVGGPVVVNTCGSFYDSVISVYQGACNDLSLLVCNDDSCGLQSSASFLAEAGRTYFIQVGGFLGEAGPGTLSFSSGILTGPVPFGASEYYLASALRWDDARAIAQSLGGDLAAIASFEENEFLRSSVLGFDGQDRRGWIGFNDAAVEGTFVWSNGEAVGFTNWNSGEPNNANGTEHYAEMLGSSGTWNDVPINHGPTRFALIEVPGCRADFNNDGQADFFDYLDFASAFSAEDPSADFNDDGQVDFFDFLDFVAAFSECE